MIKVQSPDGTVIEFPDGTPEATISAVIKRDFGGQGGGMLEKVNAFTGNAIEGVPVVGPYIREGLDRFAEAVGGPSREQSDALLKKTSEENPITAGAGSLAGAVGGTAPLVAAAPMAMGVTGANLLTRSAASGLSSGALGLADSAVRSGGDPEAIVEGGLTSAALGTVAPGAGAVVGKVTNAGLQKLQDFVTGNGAALSDVPQRAVDFATSISGTPARQEALENSARAMGPEATLADVSPEWAMVARGAAAQPGQRDAIIQPMIDRTAGRNDRLARDLNESLGPATVPSQTKQALTEQQRAMGPEYGEVFRDARAVDNSRLADILDTAAINLRGGAQSAARNVRRMLNVAGTDELDPHPGTLFQTRQAIDGLMEGEADSKALRIYQLARQAVDDELAMAVPGIKDVDARFQEAARQKEALERGSQVMGDGKTAMRPAELQQEMVEMAAPTGTIPGPSAAVPRFREGLRADIDRVVGNSANDPSALARVLKGEGDWNREKLRLAFGDSADQALSAVDREQVYSNTFGRLSAGSDTAPTAAFNEALNRVGTPPRVFERGDTLFGTAMTKAEAIARQLLGTSSEQKAQKFAGELGKLAVAQGAERGAVNQALADILARRESIAPVGRNTEALARLLMLGGAQTSAPLSQ